MRKMARVSVVIPTYNRSVPVCQAIESVLVQQHPADEIIVVDDGSTDNTQDALKAFGKKIIVIRQENAGVSSARNAGIRRATGDWITFLDSDDVWHPNRLTILHRDIEGTTAGVHVANIVFKGPGYEKELFELRCLDYPNEAATLVTHPLNIALSYPQIDGIAIRRDWAIASEGFDPTMRIHEDSHLFCRLALHGPWLVTSEIAAEVRRIDGDSNALSDQSHLEQIYSASMKVKVFEDLCALPNLPTTQSAAIKRRLSAALLQLAEASARSEDKSSWHKMLIRSAQEHPSLKGWVKVLPPLIWGVKGFGYFPKRRTEFYRSKAGG